MTQLGYSPHPATQQDRRPAVTPAEWNVALAANVHWREAYLKLAEETRTVLEAEAPERGSPDMWSTNALMDRLYPKPHNLRGEAITVRQRMYKGLNAMARNELGDCCIRSTVPQRNKFNPEFYGWLWHRPAGEKNPEAIAHSGAKTARGLNKGPRLCPHCGGALEAHP